jgi:hypothetical protein
MTIIKKKFLPKTGKVCWGRAFFWNSQKFQKKFTPNVGVRPASFNLEFSAVRSTPLPPRRGVGGVDGASRTDRRRYGAGATRLPERQGALCPPISPRRRAHNNRAPRAHTTRMPWRRQATLSLHPANTAQAVGTGACGRRAVDKPTARATTRLRVVKRAARWRAVNRREMYNNYISQMERAIIGRLSRGRVITSRVTATR